jgi:hypothetical protein
MGQKTFEWNFASNAYNRNMNYNNENANCNNNKNKFGTSGQR